MFFIPMLIISCAKKPVYQIRAESSDYLTGLSYNEEMEIRYRFTSDDQYLYIRFDSERRDLRFQLMYKGLNLYIDTTLRQRPSFTLIYPIPASAEHHPLPEQKEFPLKEILPEISVNPVALLKIGDDTKRFNTDSIPFSGLFSITEDTESGRLIYKAAIPWTNFPNGDKFRNGSPFMLGMELSKPVNGMMMRGIPDKRQGKGMPGRGGVGRNIPDGASEGGIMGNRHSGREDNVNSPDGNPGMMQGNPSYQGRMLTEPFTFWIVVSTNQIR